MVPTSQLQARSASSTVARKRKTRLTMSKSLAQTKVRLIPGGDPTGPDEEEWKHMKVYKSFKGAHLSKLEVLSAF